jgi:hypothetical protein
MNFNRAPGESSSAQYASMTRAEVWSGGCNVSMRVGFVWCSGEELVLVVRSRLA